VCDRESKDRLSCGVGSFLLLFVLMATTRYGSLSPPEEYCMNDHGHKVGGTFTCSIYQKGFHRDQQTFSSDKIALYIYIDLEG
jgi:hypothetical protein